MRADAGCDPLAQRSDEIGSDQHLWARNGSEHHG